MARATAIITLGSVLLMYCLNSISATDYTVGDSSGWQTGVDYSTWTSGKTFAVGDNLVFNYATGAHNVKEVPSSDYSSCSASNALSTSTTGPTTVTLKTAGTHYYLCSFPGHCSAGMKLAVSVSGATSSAPSSPTTPSSTTPSTTPSSAGILSASMAVVAAGAVLLKLALF